jgi:hypothetical protein
MRTKRQAESISEGEVAFGESLLPCVVRELSDSGAKLALAQIPDLPQEFDLFIKADQTRHYCAIVRRKRHHVRVAFV